VRHGEGRFVVADDRLFAELAAGHLAAVRYARRDGGAGPAPYPDNPNGSVDGIAGITDRTGRIFGLMPHPEAFLFPENHPEWTRAGLLRGSVVLPRRGRGSGDGLAIFRRGVQAARSKGR